MNKLVLFITLVLYMTLGIIACDNDDSGQGFEAAQLRCGDTVTASSQRSVVSNSKKIVASGDVLNCSGTAVTLQGPATLDLNGKTISCDGSAGSIGILLSGEGATVKNGTVTNCEAGVYAGGGGMHTIKDIEAIDNFGEKDVDLSGGFVVLSDNNVLGNVKANGNHPVGIQLVGDGNVVVNSEVSENDHMGIVLFGDSNEVSQTQADNNNYSNIAIVNLVNNELVDGGNNNIISNVSANRNNLGHGIYIGGNSNSVSGSEANDNEVDGIRVNGSGNNISDNTALGNNKSVESGLDRGGVDLSDPHPDCVNTWRENDYDTSDSTCIE